MVKAMETASYRGLRIDFEPQQVVRELPAGVRDYWFNVYDEDGEMLFRVRMRVDPIFAHFRKTHPNELARELGLRWVHGLVDLRRYSRGETYRETRDAEWDPTFGVASVTEDGLRGYVLDAV